MRNLFAIGMLVFSSSTVFANLPNPDGIPNFGGKSAKSVKALDDTYRIGDEWGKKPVTEAVLRDASPAFRRDALATARVGGATGFYLGKFNGLHVMATNHHVYETAGACLNRSVNFPLLAARATCKKFLGTWDEIDLSLFVVEFASAADEAKVAPVAANFAFANELYAGQELLTIGFGIGSNPLRQIVANQDSDCKVFSAKSEFRLMGDPDALNPGPYKAWSFANGCDVSHGDSGSAMVDRQTGEVVGIIWTGKIPKSSKVQSSSYLNELMVHPNEDVWTELSYAVPAVKIAEVLKRVATEDQSLDDVTRATLKALVGI